MSETIAIVQVKSRDGNQVHSIFVTDDTWDNPLPRSLIWAQIEDAVNTARNHRTPDQEWIDNLRQSIQENQPVTENDLTGFDSAELIDLEIDPPGTDEVFRLENLEPPYEDENE